MSQPLLVRVSREGRELGSYPAQEALSMLKEGALLATDFYWHEGMTDWAPLARLQASEARRLLAERALLQKQEEERKAAELAKKRADEAERLRQEQAKAKEEEDRAVAEATRIRMEKERANYFRCHCCHESFRSPRGLSDMIGGGVAIIIISSLVGAFAMTGFASGFFGLPAIILFISSLGALFGLCIVLASFIRSPHCPKCESTNFSRPEKAGE
jgi:Flp pilus assembly protein TadB